MSWFHWHKWSKWELVKIKKQVSVDNEVILTVQRRTCLKCNYTEINEFRVIT